MLNGLVKSLLILALITIVICLIVFFLKRFKNPRFETLNLISGGLGSGKTSSAICRIKRYLRRRYFLWRSWKLKNDYIILSNFPIGKYDLKDKCRYFKVNWYCKKRVKCYDLSLDILTLQKRLPQNEVILVIDEFSSIASQFDFNNPIVRDNVNEFVEYFRHYTLGHGIIFAIDQCSNNIFLQVRRRANYCYNMLKCVKIPLLPITIFQYRKVAISDEVQNYIEVDKGSDEVEYRRFIFLVDPFKYYDSYAFSERYKSVNELVELKTTSINKRNDILKLLNNKEKLYYATLSNDGISKKEYLKKKD